MALGLLLLASPAPKIRWILSGILVILVLQTGWLLPVLEAQAETIIQGGEGPEANYAHLAYILLEVAKVTGLVYAGWCVAP
jgi:hypothetical protein